MIELDAALWSKLQHAYGPSTDMPDLLRQLAADPVPKASQGDEPWFSLWSALCHQGDVYSASYAAVPHLVRIRIAAKGPVNIGFFLLPACIEIARQTGRGQPLEEAVSEAYLAALRGLHACAFAHAADDWGHDMARAVAAALAVSKGHTSLAEAVLSLDEEMVRMINADETRSARPTRSG